MNASAINTTDLVKLTNILKTLKQQSSQLPDGSIKDSMGKKFQKIFAESMACKKLAKDPKSEAEYKARVEENLEYANTLQACLLERNDTRDSTILGLRTTDGEVRNFYSHRLTRPNAVPAN